MSVIQFQERQLQRREALSTENIITIVGIMTTLMIPVICALFKIFILPRCKPSVTSALLTYLQIPEIYSANTCDDALTLHTQYSYDTRLHHSRKSIWTTHTTAIILAQQMWTYTSFQAMCNQSATGLIATTHPSCHPTFHPARKQSASQKTRTHKYWPNQWYDEWEWAYNAWESLVSLLSIILLLGHKSACLLAKLWRSILVTHTFTSGEVLEWENSKGPGHFTVTLPSETIFLGFCSCPLLSEYWIQWLHAQ